MLGITETPRTHNVRRAIKYLKKEETNYVNIGNAQSSPAYDQYIKDTSPSPVHSSDSSMSDRDEMDEVDDRSFMQQQKYLSECDQARRRSCQVKISNAAIKLWQASNKIMKEKISRQEHILQNCQENYLKRAEMFLKLESDEQEAMRRAEQRVYENEQHAKRVREINQMIKEAEEIQKEEEQEKERLEMLQRKMQEDMTYQCHANLTELRTYYEKFLENMKSCNDVTKIPGVVESITKVKQFTDNLQQSILEKCRTCHVTKEDVEATSKALQEAKKLVLLSDVKIKAINEEQFREEEEKRNKAMEETNRTTSQPLETGNEQLHTVLNSFVDKDAFKRYTAIKKFHEQFVQSYENLLKDPKMKTFRFDCQKAVNIPVNAISPVSASHLQDKLTKLHRLLSGQAVEVHGQPFCAAHHPEGVAYCKDILAKKFVEQGGTTVSSKPTAAFAIAVVIMSLWVDFPDFGQLLLAHFNRQCPYLVPIFLPQVEGQTKEDYYKSLGYVYIDGEIEKQDKFLKRMAGFMHLYCAVIIAPAKRSVTKPHPLGLQEAWRWLACMVNMEPRQDICATLLYEFLQVTGHFMFMFYKTMFTKLLHLLCTDYFHKLQQITPPEAGGPVTRLECFLQKILQQRSVGIPDGMLPRNFW